MRMAGNLNSDVGGRCILSESRDGRWDARRLLIGNVSFSKLERSYCFWPTSFSIWDSAFLCTSHSSEPKTIEKLVDSIGF
jgi:hypothetical protein